MTISTLSYPTIQPSLTLDFAKAKQLDPRITFNRASSGTYTDSAGVLQTAATDVPRFDHNPTTGESLGLLVEEQRTNLLLRSEEFDNASWIASRSSVTANNQAAPNGAVTADTLTADGTADFTNAATQNTGGFSAAGDKTISAFIKKGTNNFVQIYTGNNGNVFANFDLNTGTIGTVGTQCTAAIASVGNGWYRCVVTTSQTNPTSISFNIVTSSTAPRAQVGGTSNSIYLWGAQLEKGAFPTSYIPTTTAAATRAADVASIGGSNFSSWYRQDEGTVFVRADATSNVGNVAWVGYDDGTSSNRIVVRKGFSSNYPVSLIQTAGVTQAQPAAIYALADGIVASTALAYATDSVNLSSAGVLGTEDTSASIPTVSQSTIGFAVGNDYTNGTISRLTYWPARLPDSTLQTITQ